MGGLQGGGGGLPPHSHMSSSEHVSMFLQGDILGILLQISQETL